MFLIWTATVGSKIGNPNSSSIVDVPISSSLSSHSCSSPLGPLSSSSSPNIIPSILSPPRCTKSFDVAKSSGSSMGFSGNEIYG
jgi:hypothetical protein